MMRMMLPSLSDGFKATLDGEGNEFLRLWQSLLQLKINPRNTVGMGTIRIIRFKRLGSRSVAPDGSHSGHTSA